MAYDLAALVQAVRTHKADDAWRPRFASDAWTFLSNYLERRELPAGEALVTQGAVERSLHMVESGSLRVFVTQDAAQGQQRRIAILHAGAIVGEPGLFAPVPRMAHVEAMTRCVVWSLNQARLEDLMSHHGALALELLRSAGEVMARRMRANLDHGAPIG